MPVYVGRWRKLVYASRFLTRLKPVNTACRHKLANPVWAAHLHISTTAITIYNGIVDNSNTQ